MDVLRQVMVVAALVAATPAWASGGHERDGDRGERNYHGRGYDQRPDWRHHQHHHWHGHRAPRHRYYSQYYYDAPPTYYAPAPVYGYAPPPGVHIVAPNVFIPFR